MSSARLDGSALQESKTAFLPDDVGHCHLVRRDGLPGITRPGQYCSQDSSSTSSRVLWYVEAKHGKARQSTQPRAVSHEVHVAHTAASCPQYANVPWCVPQRTLFMILIVCWRPCCRRTLADPETRQAHAGSDHFCFLVACDCGMNSSAVP